MRDRFTGSGLATSVGGRSKLYSVSMYILLFARFQHTSNHPGPFSCAYEAFFCFCIFAIGTVNATILLTSWQICVVFRIENATIWVRISKPKKSVL